METHNFNAIIHLARRCLHKQIEKLFQQLSLYTSLSLSLAHSLYAFRLVGQTENERGGERERETGKEPKHEAPFKLVYKPFPHYWSAQGGHRQKEEQTNRGTSTHRQTPRKREMERERDRQKGRSRWSLHMYLPVCVETFTCSVTTKNFQKK